MPQQYMRWLVGLTVVLGSVMQLAATGSTQRRLPRFEIPNKQYRLRNGLRVVLSRDESAPTCAICVVYDVGSRDERRGQTGWAHLIEHLMFSGTSNVNSGEFASLIRTSGGFHNGTTNTDRTNYCEALPANQITLALYLEADRMASLPITAEKLDVERKVVQEERNVRIDNKAYGRSTEALHEIAYDTFAYRHSMIGSPADLNAATARAVQEFRQKYYLPNNAVLVVVGSFRPDETLEIIRGHFERIPSGPAPPKPDLTPDSQTTERRRTVKDLFAKAPRVDISYRLPAGNTPDWYALAVAGDVLAEGRSSPLHRKLVLEEQVATSVSWKPQQRRAAALGTFTMMMRRAEDAARAEAILYGEIERLKQAPVENWRIEKVRRDYVLTTAERFQSSYYRAMVLSEFTLFYNEPQLINTFVDKLYRVGHNDIQRAVQIWWTEKNRAVLVTLPRTSRRSAGVMPQTANQDEQ